MAVAFKRVCTNLFAGMMLASSLSAPLPALADEEKAPAPRGLACIDEMDTQIGFDDFIGVEIADKVDAGCALLDQTNEI